MENSTKKQEVFVDWFAINMHEFTRLYIEYVEAVKKHKRAVAERDAIDARGCEHKPKKKDGTPDRRKGCPIRCWERADAKAERLENELYYYHHAEFFEAIGIGVDA